MSEINRWSTSAGGALQNASGYFPEGQAPSTVNDAARTIMAELRRHQQATSGLKTATYATQAYSVTFDREVTAGERAGIWSFIADEANHSGSATLNINALGAKDLRKPSGHLETSDINAKQICVVAYNATGDYYELLSRTTKELNIVNQPVVSEVTASDSVGLYVKATGRHSQISAQNLFGYRVDIIASGTVSSAATLSLTGMSSAYRMCELVFDGFRPATDNQSLYLRLSDDDGATYEADASDYAWARDGDTEAAGGAESGDDADSEIEIYAGAGDQAAEQLSGHIRFYNPGGAGVTNVTWSVAGQNATPIFVLVSGAGALQAAGATTAMRLLFASGNIAAGNYTLYGYRAS